MKRFAASLARSKGIKPPAGYAKSGAICREFLDLHAPEQTARDTEGEPAGAAESRPPSSAQMSFAEAIARDKGVAVPGKARTSSAAMSKWIDANRGSKPAKGLKSPASRAIAATAKGKTARARIPRKRKSGSAEESAQPGSARTDSRTGTPLRIPYGNKEAAFELGARYAAEGWHAPPGVDLAAFRERGWL